MNNTTVQDYVIHSVPRSMAVALVAAFSPFIHGRVLLDITEGPVEPPVQSLRFFKGKLVVNAMRGDKFYALHIPLKYGYDKQRVRSVYRAWLRLACFAMLGEDADREAVLTTVLATFGDEHV